MLCPIGDRIRQCPSKRTHAEKITRYLHSSAIVYLILSTSIAKLKGRIKKNYQKKMMKAKIDDNN